MKLDGLKRPKRHACTLKAGNAEMIWTPSRSVHCDEASLSTMMVKSAHTSTSADQSRYALTPFIYSPFIDILEFSSVTRLPLYIRAVEYDCKYDCKFSFPHLPPLGDS